MDKDGQREVMNKKNQHETINKMNRRKKILVVEDDAAISDIVCSTLSEEGYECLPAYSGTEARMLIEQNLEFDLAICDLMLPGLSGEDLVALIRSKSTVPILVTSAKAQVIDRVTLLRMGADDYLVKPFDLDELSARVEALLRRSVGMVVAGATHGQGSESFENEEQPRVFGAWRLFENARRLEVNGHQIRLTRTEFDIVAALVRHPQKVFTKRELYEAAWHEEALVEEKAINTHISNIRSKLKVTGTDVYIETVWGIGFKLADLQ